MSSKRKRLGLIGISIIIASFLTGYSVGVYSNGSNPTIDPLEGIYNMPWFNATAGIYAPEFWHEDLGNYTAWVLSIEGGGGVTDHGALTGLGDDDHSLYLLQSGVEGLTGDWDIGNYDLTAKYMTADEFYRTGIGNYSAWIESLVSISDHGDLTGLDDDDHSAYVDKDGAEGLTGDWDVGNYEITTDGLTSPWLDLGGDNRTVWPSGSGNASPGYYDIIIQVDSGTYTATHCNGTELWSSSDAESVFYNSNAFFGGNPGHIKFGTGTFDFDDTLHPSSFITLSGMGKAQTILRPASDAVVPLIALDECQGVADRQESMTLKDFEINLRTFAGSVGIEMYNLKTSIIRDVDIRYFKLYGLYSDSSNARYSMAIILEDMFFEAGSGGATAAMYFDDGDGLLDSWMSDIWGEIPDTTYGLYVEAMGDVVINDMHWNFPDNAFYLNPNGGGEGGVIYYVHFNRPISDNCQKDAWYLDFNNGGCRGVTIAYPHFINTADTYDLFEIDMFSVTERNIQIYGGTAGGTLAHEWIMDCTNPSLLQDWTISHMKIPAGDTGAYNGVPTHFITDDVAYTNSSYQIDSGVWSDPIWVGTPYDGWTIRMYNADTTPYYRIYTYMNGGWHYFDADG